MIWLRTIDDLLRFIPWVGKWERSRNVFTYCWTFAKSLIDACQKEVHLLKCKLHIHWLQDFSPNIPFFGWMHRNVVTDWDFLFPWYHQSLRLKRSTLLCTCQWLKVNMHSWLWQWRWLLFLMITSWLLLRPTVEIGIIFETASGTVP